MIIKIAFKNIRKILILYLNQTSTNINSYYFSEQWFQHKVFRFHTKHTKLGLFTKCIFEIAKIDFRLNTQKSFLTHKLKFC